MVENWLEIRKPKMEKVKKLRYKGGGPTAFALSNRYSNDNTVFDTVFGN